MMHRPVPAAGTGHGIFSRDLSPALTIASGDTMMFQALDAGWGAPEQQPGFTAATSFGRATCGATAPIA